MPIFNSGNEIVQTSHLMLQKSRKCVEMDQPSNHRVCRVEKVQANFNRLGDEVFTVGESCSMMRPYPNLEKIPLQLPSAKIVVSDSTF